MGRTAAIAGERVRCEDPSDYRTEYGSRAERWKFLAVPVLRHMQAQLGTDDLAARVGVHRRSIERVLRRVDPSIPHTPTRRRYLDTASAWVAPQLLERGILPGRDLYGALWCHSKHVLGASLRVCQVCGRPLLHPLAKYCGERCKKRAYRGRRSV
jgi:hypothetical protein